MNPKPRPLQGQRLPIRRWPHLRTLLSWLVISAQILVLLSSATVGAIQPTPQLASEAAQQVGLGDWLAQRAGDLVAWAQPLWGEPASAQAATTYGTPVALLSTTHSATITTGRTGLCTILNCFITNSANVIDANTANVGNINIPLGLLGGVYFSVDTTTTFPAGYRAGFLIDKGSGLIDLSLFSSFSLTTYLGGVQQENISSAALLDVSLFGGPNSNAVSFVTSKAFDEVRLTAGSLIGALLNLDVFYAFVQQPTYSPAPGGVGTDLIVWYKAGSGISVTDGQNVPQWSSQAAPYHATQASAGSQPVYYSTNAANLLNYNPSLNFDGADGINNTNRMHASTNGWQGIVVGKDKRTNVAELRAPLGLGDNGNDPGFDLQTDGISPNGWNVWMDGSSPAELGGGTFDSTAPLYNGNGGGTNQQPQIFALGSANTAGGSGNIISTIDGFNETTDMDSAQEAGIGGGLYIGSSGGENWLGLIGEVLVYNKQLSAAELNQVNSYLAIKYGITLDANPSSATQNFDYVLSDGATVVWPGTSDAAYQAYRFDVAGIGRDDGSALDQRKSSSVNTGIQPIIDNGAAFGADKSFLMWGGDSGANSLATTYTPNGFTPSAGYFRTTRIWKVTETGTVGNVTVSVANGSADHLLVDNDGNFTDGNTQEIAFVSGSATVNFTNGQYFTFGANVTAPGGVAGNMTAWWKADMGAETLGNAAANNDSVDAWQDQSLNDNDAFQSTGSLKPEWLENNGKFNFNPSLTFVPNARMQAQFAAANWDNNDGSIYVIYNQQTAYTAWRNLVDFGLTAADSNNPQLGMSDNDRIATWMDGFDRDNTTFQPLINETRLVGYYWQFNVGGHTYTYDGQPYTGASGHKLGAGAHGSGLDIGNFANIGGDPQLGEYFPGQIAEIVVYKEQHNAATQARVQSYFGIKYGVTVDANPTNAATNFDYVDSAGTTIWAGNGANSSYHNDVAGIGRDDAAALNQKQSKSVNSDDIVTISLGAPAATNAANTNTFSANQSFLVWGNNNGAASYAVSYTPTSFTPAASYYRMGRVWKVQETGTITDVVVQAAGAGHLLVDDDGNFTNGGTTEIALSGDTVTVDFANGEYFTFGTEFTAPGAVLNGLAFWSKADGAGCAPGDSCVDWDDLSSNGNAIETVGAMTLQPADEGHNFYPFFADFSTTSYFKDMDSSLATPWPPIDVTEVSVFTVVHANSLTDDGRITGMDNDDNLGGEPGLSIVDGSPAFYRFSSGPGRVTLTEDVAVNTSAIFGARTSGTQLTLGLDGKYTASALTAGGGFAGDIFNIGYGTWDINGPFPGDIQEVIWYRTDVSDTERQRIESYLALKYGITLDQSTAQNYLASDGTTLTWNATANAAYSNNIAGIGRDDATGLHQKQSTSTNVGFQLVMGLGTIVASNAANSNTFSANKSFLLWGDNNGALTLSAAYNGGSNNRLARVWKVQETGTVGAVKVVLPRAAVPTAGLRSLIVHSSDGAFGTVDRTIPLTSSGGNYVAMVNFNNGDYFSFSSSSTLPEINVTPGVIDFVEVNTGSTSPAQAVTIQNLGDVSLSLSSISLSGADAARFAISSNNCGGSLAAGGSCTVNLTFTPTTTGAKSALLVINSNDSDEGAVNVVLSGTTPDPASGGALSQYNLAITKSASVVNATVGTPFSYTITVYNQGNVAASNAMMSDTLPASVTFNSANATGGGACNHASGTVTCTWPTLAAGASATVTISVTP